MIHGLWFIHECDADRYISQDHNTHLSHLLLQLEYFLITKPSSTQSNKTTIQYMHCNTSQPPHTVHRAKQVQPIRFCVSIKHYKLCKYSYLSYCSFEAQIKVPCSLGAQEAKKKNKLRIWSILELHSYLSRVCLSRPQQEHLDLQM